VEQGEVCVKPRTFDARETAKLLPYGALADAIGAALLEYSRGRVRVPERLILELPAGGKLLVMPAADDEIAVTKLVTVHPGNGTLGLPTIQGEVVAMRSRNGERIGVLDGATVTGRRTAALSLLAARRLAPVPQGPLLVFGAGAQARAHVEAFRDGLGVDSLFIASPTRSRAEAMAEHARALGMTAEAVASPTAALDEAKLIVTATTSRTPVLAGRLAEDVMVCAVGAFRADMAEVSPELVGASSVVVDTLHGAQEEAGDLIGAEREGVWGWERARTLAEVLAGPRLELPGPILFKSVGHALFDLASARVAFRA
jgi:1-piperideine-2-carboxylate/1-pyrroline-2-carboxylate reductase [NAD(P)H]